MAEEHIEFTEKARRYARHHPEEYPETLLIKVVAALDYMEQEQREHYMDTSYEPIIGFLRSEWRRLREIVYGE